MGETAPTDLSAEDKAYVRAVVRRSGSSFAAAMATMTRPKRDAMYALYAFCREVDDIADDPGVQAEKVARLAQWRVEVEHLYAGSPGGPISRALAAAAEKFGFAKDDLVAVIEGMEMDAANSLRIADMGELRLYCDRVACAVGRLSCRVFGIDRATGDRLAAALGEALQLTNILRDIHEDAGRDRLYLPADLLGAHGIAATTPAAILADPALPRVCEHLADLTRSRFAEAEAILAVCDRRRARPAAVMMHVYRRVLERLVERGWRRLAEPAKPSRWEKLWIVFRYGLL